ncbi:helix-turn-helix domain-containing protein [Shewanella amazonensis]|uniref:Transcriptional regulator, AraC family n=1 Tax=Shewanella amazonensis (strain ATCC BAA-1098 / SB2B) TaxID=326297 RepID=A1S961_SHEAM|nr:helix-turn-helix domain-containing protein [Shewanella amazonensis]ABM00918.1 transcriptional regulator, AraC family [Shewanella amazonensis SB2B]
MSTLPHLGFQVYQPCAPLLPYVRCYWQITRIAAPETRSTEFMHPEGGTGIIFNFGAPMHFDGWQHRAQCLVTGPTKQSTRLELSGRVDALGIRFWPGAGRAFLKTPLSEMLGQTLTPADLSLALLSDELAERLAVLPTAPERIALLETRLLHYLTAHGSQTQTTEPSMKYALNWIAEQKGQGEIRNLLTEIDISQRQLERLFQQNLGMSPKNYSILQRTGFARELLKSDTDSPLTDIGYQAGFYDQAHFIREFKQVIGITPGQFRSKALLRR